jgi:hypothetical protein
MTKGEILKNKFLRNPDGKYNPVEEAMEAYAKQERISILKYAQYQSTRNPEQLEKMYLESKEK